MGHTVDNGLNFTSINQDIYKQGQDLRTGSDFGVDKTRIGAPEEEIVTGYKYERGNSSLVNSTVDNFEEYLKNKQEKAKEAGEDAVTEERQAKEDAKEISRSLSGEEIKQLKMMGIDVEGARLSDLMGMVNTLRGEAHRQEMQQLLAGVSAGKGDMEGITFIGGTAKLAGTDIELDNVDVADVLTQQEPEVQQQETPGEGFKLGQEELVYIIKNNLDFSKENMYKAHYSGSVVNNKGISETVLKEMQPQIDKVIEQAGFLGDASATEGAKFLMDNNLPVTTDNLRTYMAYQDYLGKDVAEVDFSNVQKELFGTKGEELFTQVAALAPEVAYDMVYSGRQLTIASISSYTKSVKGKVSAEAEKMYAKVQNNNVPTEDETAFSKEELKAVTAMRQIEEIRLSMTVSAATKLVKSDLNIDTRELSKVVNQLKNLEEQMIRNKLREAGIQPTEDNISLYNEITDKIQGLGEKPAAALGAPFKGLTFSVNVLYEESTLLAGKEISAGQETGAEQGKGLNSEQALLMARKSYEAVGTVPRRDMGDSITKAFSNVADMLKEMNIPVNYETERAVRILGYNSIEITQENINQVMHYDRQVNMLMDTFYPEAVLSMIKDGINPLDVSIEELNQVIQDRNYNQGVTEAENFATYLRDMEKQGLVSPEERESYIGIYRVMDKLAKSGDREAGWVFHNGSELTVRNLISAMRSRKATGLNVTLDDDFGMLDTVTTKGKDMEKQIEAAFNNLDAVEDNAVEDVENVSDYMKQVSELADEVWNYLKENGIEATGVNAMAVNTMLKTPGGIYQLVSEILSKMKFSTNTKAEMIDEETEKMSDSMTGEEIPVEFLPENILESLRGKEEMSLKYEDLRDRLTELMYSSGIAGSITGMDISVIKTVNAGFNIMSHMAKQDRYQLPVTTEDGTKVVNLTILHSEGERGTIEVSMDGGSLGSLVAKIRVTKSGIIGHLVAGTSEGNYALQEREEDIRNNLSKAGYNVDGFTAGTSSASISVGSSDFVEEGETLYQVAVTMVKTIGSVSAKLS